MAIKAAGSGTGARMLIGFGAAIAAVLVLAVLVRLAEPSLAFFPSPGEDVTPRTLGVTFEAITVPTSDGERLRAWWLPRSDARAAVLYFHGNGGNLSLWTPLVVGLHRRGYSVLAFDYRGYGLSTGRPSERGLLRDADAALDTFARLTSTAGAPRVYWGRSLGTAIAAYAASQRAPDGLILEAGFPNARAIVRANPVCGRCHGSPRTASTPRRGWNARDVPC